MNTRTLKIVLIIVLSIAVILGILAAIASPIAKHVINNRGEDIIGRQMHAERVGVNIFNGDVTVRDFHCKEQNGTTDFVNFERLYVRIAYPQLLFKRVTIRHIHLDHFNGEVLQNRNKLNFSDIIERFRQDPNEPEDSTKTKWLVKLDDIRIKNSSIYYHDVIHKKEWKLEDISLSVPGLDFGKKQNDVGLEFALPTGGRVGVSASYMTQTNTLSVLLNLFDVHADVMLPLVQDYVNVSGLGAKLNGTLRAEAQLDNIENIHVDGSLGMKGLCLRDGHKNEVASLDELRAVINRCDLHTNTYILDSLLLYGLTAKYEVHKNWNTLSRLLKSNDGSSSSSKKGKAKPITWKAKAAVLTGHDITYMDYSMKHDWQYAIKSLRVEGDNVSSNGRNNLRLNAVLQNKGIINAQFVGGLNVKKHNTHFSITMTNVNLEDFDAACRNYTGYPIESGILHLDNYLNFTSGQLEGSTKLIIENASVGKKEALTKAPYRNVPVRSTVRMLSDSQKRIILTAPVAADATKPKFDLKKVLTKSLLKVSFGRMAATKSKKDKISQEEMDEIEALISDNESSTPKESGGSKRDRRRNGRKK